MYITEIDRLRARLAAELKEADYLRGRVREEECDRDGEPIFLTSGIRTFREVSSGACRKAMLAGDVDGETKGWQGLLLAAQAETIWWGYALRRLTQG